tara:strand:- start:455 stop:1345 length:891 start_codon:yes stop_codon:yes gene_type:complete
MEKQLIPVGYLELGNAVDALGNDMFRTAWTGEERGYFKTGYFGQEFRSKIEYETDSAFRDAVLYARCELECEMYGGDPQQRYELRKAPVDDDEPFMPMGDLPTLSADKMKEIEGQFSEQLAKAMATRERREEVEDVFLRKLLWSGSVVANFVAIDGKVTGMEPHIWGTDEGKLIFERGWIELDKGSGCTTVRSVLVKECDLEDHLSSAPAAKQQSKVAAERGSPSTATRFSRAEVRTWYQAYVERLSSQDKKSSRDDDLAAARKQFSTKIPRDFMRELRRELAPPEWTAKGAPKRT